MMARAFRLVRCAPLALAVACASGGNAPPAPPAQTTSAAAPARAEAPAAEATPPADAPYRQKARPVEERVADLLGRMTLLEKVTLLSGKGFDSRGVPRLGIPDLRMSDGPNGVRWGQFGTAYPPGIAMAATWDPALIERLGHSLGRETLAKGRHVLLGPCVNQSRVPQNGRTFECFGEDPALASRLVVGYVRGVQAEGAIATVKHYCCNEQEHRRMDIDVRLDERTLHEIYLPPFKAAVQEGGVWAVMTAYNKVNGAFASENRYLVTDVLKNQWGFQGLVMSDWGAVHSTVPTALAGLDLEMPEGEFTGEAKLLPAIERGEVGKDVVDDKVRRILRVMFVSGAFDRPVQEDAKAAFDSPDAKAVALDVARGALTLLKNDRGALPVEPGKVKTVAVIGPGAVFPRVHGGGSGGVRSFAAKKPLDELRAKLEGAGVKVTYTQGFVVKDDVATVPAEALGHRVGDKIEPGLLAEYFGNRDLAGKPVLTRVEKVVDLDWLDRSPGEGVPADGFSSRFSGVLLPKVAGRYQVGVSANDAARVYVDGKLVIDKWFMAQGDQAVKARLAVPEVTLEARPYDVRVEHFEGKGWARVNFAWSHIEGGKDEAVAAAKAADVAIVFAGLSAHHESEAFDHDEITLPADQVAVIEAVAKANRRTIVVLSGGSPLVLEPWVGKVPAVLHAYYAGQEGGTAIAEVLTGAVSPSGKLPYTLMRSWNDHPAKGTYPETEGGVPYREGIFVGYRHYDAKKLPVTFPFGHGLSYTSFAWKNLSVAPAADGVTVRFQLANTGKRAGAEVAQVYVADQAPAVARPARELKAFQKIALGPRETREITLTLGREAFSYWDQQKHEWAAKPGTFEIAVGASSRDLKLRQTVAWQPR